MLRIAGISRCGDAGVPHPPSFPLAEPQGHGHSEAYKDATQHHRDLQGSHRRYLQRAGGKQLIAMVVAFAEVIHIQQAVRLISITMDI